MVKRLPCALVKPLFSSRAFTPYCCPRALHMSIWSKFTEEKTDSRNLCSRIFRMAPKSSEDLPQPLSAALTTVRHRRRASTRDIPHKTVCGIPDDNRCGQEKPELDPGSVGFHGHIFYLSEKKKANAVLPSWHAKLVVAPAELEMFGVWIGKSSSSARQPRLLTLKPHEAGWRLGSSTSDAASPIAFFPSRSTCLGTLPLNIPPSAHWGGAPLSE